MTGRNRPYWRDGRHRPLHAAVVSVLLLLLGCGVEEIVMERFRGETPHERYLERIERSGLGETALARDWARAATEALASPVRATLPMYETGWFPAEHPIALGYLVDVARGQRIQVQLALDEEPPDGATAVFIEIFRLRGDPEAVAGSRGEGLVPRLLTVAWADSLDRELAHDAASSATYLVRVQPELLRGGSYRVTLSVGASLAFPVEGADRRSILSLFGAARDGGARQHHGVDIFAPRGTPVLAASAGRVRRVAETPIGGKVVWLRNEERGHSEYYAHLDAQLVETGQWVEAGDTIGLVGNTGNAITTPPHLHFGIYSRGPVDPLPFLTGVNRSPAPLRVPADLFHTRARINAGGAPIRSGPSPAAEVLGEAEPDLTVHILAGSGDWARIRLPDGRQGFVQHQLLEPIRQTDAGMAGG